MQDHCQDAVVASCEVIKLGHEVHVIVAPAVNQDEGRLPTACLFVEQRHPVAMQTSHELIITCLRHP